MNEQTSVQTNTIKKSVLPIIALALSILSTFSCCISFAVNNPNGFDAFIQNNPVWYVAQALMCLASLLALTGVILGVISIRKKENLNISIAALVIGVPTFIAEVLIFGYVMFFIGIFRVFSP